MSSELFNEELKKKGIAGSRIESLYKAMESVHSALSYLDNENMGKVRSIKIEGLLNLYVKSNPGLRKIDL